MGKIPPTNKNVKLTEEELKTLQQESEPKHSDLTWLNDIDDINTLQSHLNMELERWKLAHMDPGKIQQNLFNMNSTLRGIGNLLIEKGILTEDEITLATGRQTLQSLIYVREANEAKVLQARLMEGIAQGGKTILGPDGKKLDL